MRVTKTVKEYILKEVKTKFAAKYAEDEQLDNYQRATLDRAKEEALKAATKQYLQVLKTYEEQYDFIKVDPEYSLTISGWKNAIEIIDSPLKGWRSRMNDDIKNKVDEIVVELELGGNKETLVKLLSEI